MRKIVFSFIALVIATSGFTQVKPAWKKIFTQINNAVQANSRAYSTLRESSETIGHRLTGSENGAKAEQYAYDLLKSYGFEDVRFQPFEMESWARGTVNVSIGKVGAPMQDVKSVALAHTPVEADVYGELIDMGNGLEDDYKKAGDKVKGKIALVYLGILPNSGEGLRNLHRSEKTALAIQYGAVGIIIINTVDGGVLLTGTASVTGKLIPIPAACIGKEDGLKLKERLKEEKLSARISMTNFSGTIKARNVIATIKGKKLPNEKIVVGGHLDSWDLADGSIDNGIGSFSVIDMARTFKALNLRPDRTVEFVLFMGEEQGLLGSTHYVEQALADGSINNIRLMLNYDMTNDPRGYSATSPLMEPLVKGIGEIVKSIDPSFENIFNSRAGLHSDHEPFMLQGVITGGAAGGRLPNNAGRCYHSDCDSFNLVEEQGMKNTVRFNSMLIYGLADAKTIPAKRRSDEETKAFLEKNNLKEALIIAGDWRWEK